MAQVIGFLLAAAMGLILLADVMGVFEEGVADVKEGQADTLIARLRANVQVAFANQADLGDDTDLVPILIDLDKIPRSAMNADGDGILHPYGGEVTILGDGERMAVTLADMDDDQCARAATKLVGGRGVVNIEVAADAPDEVSEKGSRVGKGVANGYGAGPVFDDVEEVSVLAGCGVGPLARAAGAAKADEEGVAARSVDVADDPVPAFAAAVGEVMPADRFSLGCEGCGDVGCVCCGGLHGGVLPV